MKEGGDADICIVVRIFNGWGYSSSVTNLILERNGGSPPKTEKDIPTQMSLPQAELHMTKEELDKCPDPDDPRGNTTPGVEILKNDPTWKLARSKKTGKKYFWKQGYESRYVSNEELGTYPYPDDPRGNTTHVPRAGILKKPKARKLVLPPESQRNRVI
jgi:hypothetical protein